MLEARRMPTTGMETKYVKYIMFCKIPFIVRQYLGLYRSEIISSWTRTSKTSKLSNNFVEILKKM